MQDEMRLDKEEEFEPQATAAEPEPDLTAEGEHLSAPETDTDEAVATAAEPEPEEDVNFVEEIAAPEQQLAVLQEKLAQTEDRLMRTMADFENYRRRAMKDKQEMLLYAAERPLNEILPILDNLERAVAHADDGNPESIQEGVRMILNLFGQTLERMEVLPVGMQGEAFDPNTHEAMQQIPSQEVAANHIVEVFQKGYKLRDRLIRPAKVVVSSGAPAPASAPAPEADESVGEG